MKKRFALLFMLLLTVCFCLTAAATGTIDLYSKKDGDVFYPTSTTVDTSDRRIYFAGWASTAKGMITDITFDIESQNGMLLYRFNPHKSFDPADAELIKQTAGGKNAVRFSGTVTGLSNRVLTEGTKYVFKIHVFYTADDGSAGVYAMPGLPDANGNKVLSALNVTYANDAVSPAVLDMGDGYSVTWVADFEGLGWITYTYQGKEYKVYDERNGIRRTDDHIHFVKVPKAHLDGNTYRVFSQPVTNRGPYSATFGAVVDYGSYNFRGYAGQNEIKMLTLSDVHGYWDLVKQAVYRYNTTPDLILLNGDIDNYIQHESQIDSLFNLAGDLSGGTCPVFYLRGNHETRGMYASELFQYLPTATGEFFYTSSYGPVSITCMDMGEDKPDNHVEYGGLVEFKKQRQKQLAWMKTLPYDESATYRINFCHTSTLSNHIDTNFASELARLGISLSIAGHSHVNRLLQPSSSQPFYSYEEGSHINGTDFIGSMVTLKDGKTAELRSFDCSGKLHVNTDLDLSVIERTTFSSKTEAPAEEESTSAIKLGDDRSLSTSISVTAPPVIFETGGDDFTICWETSIAGTGSVSYTYNGTEYTVNDAVGGNLRTQDTIHSVKVPKKHLLGNSYKIYSKNMEVHMPYSFVDGPSVSAGPYFCVDPTATKTVELLVIPDMKSTPANENYGIMANTAITNLIANPRILIMNGDVSSQLQTKAEFGAVLRAAAYCGGSHCPTVFVRGNLDCRGEFAYHLIDYLQPANGEYYFTFTYGNVSAIVLDSGEDKADSHSEYFGTVDFAQYRKKQTAWLETVSFDEKATVRLVIKHFQNKPDFFTEDWEAMLCKKGANLGLYGNAMSVGRNDYAGFVGYNCGGITADRADFNAVSVTLSNQYAYVYAKNKNNTTVFAQTVDLTTGSTPSHGAPTEPPTENGSYQISMPEHLLWLQTRVDAGEHFSGVTFELTNNIDLKMIPFTPIGGNTPKDQASDEAEGVADYFSGTFDGNGYLIKNINIFSDAAYVGLFGLVKDGRIQNTELYGGKVSNTGMYVGSLAGMLKNSTVSDCGSDLLVATIGGGKAGGLVGFTALNSSLLRVAVSAALRSGGVDGGLIGGITGQVYHTTITITDSYFAGEVFASVGGYVGGIAGFGGQLQCQINNCYNSGKLYGHLVGQILATYNNNSSHSVINCRYPTNLMTSKAFASGDTMTHGSGSYTVLPSAEMQQQDFPATLSDSFIYDETGINDGYPILAWQKPIVPTIDITCDFMVKQGEACTVTNATKDAYASTYRIVDETGATVTDETLAIGKYTLMPVAYDKYGNGYTGEGKVFYVSQSGYVYPERQGDTVTIVAAEDCPTDRILAATYQDGRMISAKAFMASDTEKTVTVGAAENLVLFLWDGICPKALCENLQ